jgi:hypothetical protein
MSKEVIDIFIISVIFLLTLLFVINKLRKALTKEGGNKCSGCSVSSCGSNAKKDCQTVEVFK